MGTSAATGRRTCVSLDAFKGFNREGFAAFLRKLYPYDTAANVAADIEISDRTVDNWISLSSEPRASALLRLTAAYGPDVLASASRDAPPWLDAASREVRMAQLEQELADLRGSGDRT